MKGNSCINCPYCEFLIPETCVLRRLGFEMTSPSNGVKCQTIRSWALRIACAVTCLGDVVCMPFFAGPQSGYSQFSCHSCDSGASIDWCPNSPATCSRRNTLATVITSRAVSRCYAATSMCVSAVIFFRSQLSLLCNVRLACTERRVLSRETC